MGSAGKNRVLLVWYGQSGSKCLNNYYWILVSVFTVFLRRIK